MGVAEALTDWLLGERPELVGWFNVKTSARKGDWFAHWNGMAWSDAYEDAHALRVGRMTIAPSFALRYHMGLQRPFRGFKVKP